MLVVGLYQRYFALKDSKVLELKLTKKCLAVYAANNCGDAQDDDAGDRRQLKQPNGSKARTLPETAAFLSLYSLMRLYNLMDLWTFYEGIQSDSHLYLKHMKRRVTSLTAVMIIFHKPSSISVPAILQIYSLPEILSAEDGVIPKLLFDSQDLIELCKSF